MMMSSAIQRSREGSGRLRWEHKNLRMARVVSLKSMQEQPQIPFGLAQGRLSTHHPRTEERFGAPFAEDDSDYFCYEFLGQDQGALIDLLPPPNRKDLPCADYRLLEVRPGPENFRPLVEFQSSGSS